MEPDDIELGPELLAIERWPRSGVVLSVRLLAEQADQLEAIAERLGITFSQAGHAAIESYLNVHARTAESTEAPRMADDAMLGIQQTADLLNVSRPFLVKLLDAVEIPFQ